MGSTTNMWVHHDCITRQAREVAPLEIVAPATTNSPSINLAAASFSGAPDFGETKPDLTQADLTHVTFPTSV
jgi:hypothetical protein